MTEEKKEPWNLRIGIGTPETGSLKAGTAFSLVSAVNHFLNMEYDGAKEIVPIFVNSSMLCQSRHKVVLEAISKECTHLLWMDSDMMFPADSIKMLLRHNKPIVGVNYARRGLPTQPTAVKDGKILYTEPDDTDLIEVDHLGFGLLMTDMRLYKCLNREEDGETVMDMPFFHFEIKEDGVGLYGEDVYFCNKVRKAGIPIYCDQELSNTIGHVGEMPFLHSHALKCREEGVFTQEDLLKKIEDSAA